MPGAAIARTAATARMSVAAGTAAGRMAVIAGAAPTRISATLGRDRGMAATLGRARSMSATLGRARSMAATRGRGARGVTGPSRRTSGAAAGCAWTATITMVTSGRVPHAAGRPVISAAVTVAWTTAAASEH
jgi:hypothetical protein